MKFRLACAIGLTMAALGAPTISAAKDAKAIYQGVTEELFQTYIVGLGLEELGYDVDEPIIAQM